jgi:hypothetical protein
MENNTNIGDRNSGNRNSGVRNSGNWNSGNWNSGNWNSGNWNSGNCNSGDWNSGDRNNGFFNNQTPNEVLAFGKLTNREEFLESCRKIDFLYFDLVKYVHEEDMTKEEKLENQNYEKTGGYLKTFEYKEAFQNSYISLSEEERIKQTKLLRELPNFDKDIFFNISGIDIDQERKLSKEEYIEKYQDELYQKYLKESEE